MTRRTLGERVAEHRRQRGISQRELAAAMNRSESWVSQVERDIQPVERPSVLHALAQALGVSLRDLRPEAVPEADDTDQRPNDLDGLRLELSGHPTIANLFTKPEQSAEPVDLDQLHYRVEEAWTLAHDSRFTLLGPPCGRRSPRATSSLRNPPFHPRRAKQRSARVASTSRCATQTN